MAKSETIRARIEPEIKKEAEAIFRTLGLSSTEAITLFYRQVALHHGLPFEVRIPNAETQEALRQAQENENLTTWNSTDDLIKSAG